MEHTLGQLMNLEHKINQQFIKLVDELDLGWHNKQERDWRFIGTGLSAGLLLPLAPLTVPLTTAYAATFGSKRHYAEFLGTLGVAAGLALGPIVLPFLAISEIVDPSPKVYLHLGKENIIITENHSSLPAVYLEGTPKQFSSIDIYFSSGEAGSIPNPNYNKVPRLENYQRALNKIKYDQAAHFLNISSNVNAEMNRILQERTNLERKYLKT